MLQNAVKQRMVWLCEKKLNAEAPLRQSWRSGFRLRGIDVGGWTGEVLVAEKGKVAGSWIGRNFAYKTIALNSNVALMGKTLKSKGR
jgi:hypothetical protein